MNQNIEYSIGDAVVKIDQYPDNEVHYISEIPGTHGQTVVLNGYRYETGVQFIRPARDEEILKRQRII